MYYLKHEQKLSALSGIKHEATAECFITFISDKARRNKHSKIVNKGPFLLKKSFHGQKIFRKYHC
jgi:hypothetical protein